MNAYLIVIKVDVKAHTLDEAHEIATRFCDTIGYGKNGEVLDIYADKVEEVKDVTIC